MKMNLKIEDRADMALLFMIRRISDSSLVSVPNVNKKNAREVLPREFKITLDNKSLIITLPANSVNVLVLDI